MVLQCSGSISFNDINTEFNGVKPIKFRDYYKDAITGYTNAISSLPNIGNPISFNMFYGKSNIIAIINDDGIISYLKATSPKYTFKNSNATIMFYTNVNCKVLLVGGGGGPGDEAGGGGGQLYYNNNWNYFVSNTTYNIFIGDGGYANDRRNWKGQNGGDTYILNSTNNSVVGAVAKGGGGGITSDFKLNDAYSYGASVIINNVQTLQNANIFISTIYTYYEPEPITTSTLAGAGTNGFPIDNDIPGPGYTDAIYTDNITYGQGGNGAYISDPIYTVFDNNGFGGNGIPYGQELYPKGNPGIIIISL